MKISLGSAWDFPCVADDLLTAGYIILTISHMISFRKDFKNSHTSKLYGRGTMKTSILEEPCDTYPFCAAAKSHLINQQMHH